MNEFKKMNEIYASYFVSNLPARSTIEIKALPKHGGIYLVISSARVEIECIAFSLKKK